MLMVSPSLMVLKAHVSTSGHLLQLCTRVLLLHFLHVLAPILIEHGLMKCQSLWEMTISVISVTLGLRHPLPHFMQMTLYGMVKGVVPPAPAVTILKQEFAVMVGEMMKML